MDSSTQLFGPIHLQIKGWLLILFLLFYTENPISNANSVDANQTDLGLPCLPMSLFRDTRRKWVKSFPQWNWMGHNWEKKEISRIFPILQNEYITKTCLYNIDPLKPQFYIVKLGFIGVYIIFLISAQNIDCGYSLEPPRRGGSNEYPQSMFWAEIWKISEILIWKFSFW